MSILGIDWKAYDRGVADALDGEPPNPGYDGNVLYKEGYDGASSLKEPVPAKIDTDASGEPAVPPSRADCGACVQKSDEYGRSPCTTCPDGLPEEEHPNG